MKFFPAISAAAAGPAVHSEEQEEEHTTNVSCCASVAGNDDVRARCSSDDAGRVERTVLEDDNDESKENDKAPLP